MTKAVLSVPFEGLAEVAGQVGECVYLDNHATTQLAPEILPALIELLKEHPGNAGSVEHEHGLYAKRTVDDANSYVRSFFGVPNYHVVFTSGSTESANTVINSIVLESHERPKILASVVEHPCVLEPLRYWRDQDMCELVEIGVDAKGRLRMEEIEQHAPGARLGCFMAVQNEIGNIYPVKNIGRILSENDCEFMCDATQAVGKTRMDIKHSNIDYFLFSGHKIHALQGIGCLASKRSFDSLMRGGGHQGGLRSGTLNVPGVFSLFRALQLIENQFNAEQQHVNELKTGCWEVLSSSVSGIVQTGDLENKVPHNLHCGVPNIDNSAVISRLRGLVSLSSGAACSSGTVEDSSVLRAMGVEPSLRSGVVRVGFSRYLTPSVVEKAADLIAASFQELADK